MGALRIVSVMTGARIALFLISLLQKKMVVYQLCDPMFLDADSEELLEIPNDGQMICEVREDIWSVKSQTLDRPIEAPRESKFRSKMLVVFARGRCCSQECYKLLGPFVVLDRIAFLDSLTRVSYKKNVFCRRENSLNSVS